ncbi:universal stress protein [Ramlibacter sp. AN1133]|uniref:universal stress protein n=1 Tax=Ramlibacter sp. AN1133 TaxID=3133429 RepID=UPI0030C54AA2
MPMSLRQILVHLDPTRASPRRLAAARRLAQQLGAEVAALYAITPAFIELPFAPEIGPSLAATLMELDDQRRDKVRQAFDEAMTLPGPLSTWAQTDEVPTPAAFAQQAFYADLMVLGQRDASDEAAACVPPDFVESVLLESGRPALVIPHTGEIRTLGEQVAIAWKETPEAAHALQAALPLLRQAARVHVLAWTDHGPARLGGEALDLERYLRVHGLQATWHREGPEPADLGERLLSRVCDLGADLLVMGCYGHSRAREWMLGGASRTVLASMTVPVLMAH